MNRVLWLVMSLILVLPLIFSGGCGKSIGSTPVSESTDITLPEPRRDSDTSVEEALLGRRSIRSFREAALTLTDLSQLLWAAQGVTDPSGKRTAPSAGALYPLEVYVVVGNVEGVPAGIYKYKPATHALARVIEGDQRKSLNEAAMNQTSILQGAIAIVITAVYARTTKQYGERGVKFVQLEAGHAAQNVCLQAVALKLGTVTIGYFDDVKVKKALGAAADEEPLYVMPVGQTGD